MRGAPRSRAVHHCCTSLLTINFRTSSDAWRSTFSCCPSLLHIVANHQFPDLALDGDIVISLGSLHFLAIIYCPELTLDGVIGLSIGSIRLLDRNINLGISNHTRVIVLLRCLALRLDGILDPG